MTKLIHIATVALTPRAFLCPFARHFRDQGWTVDVMARGATTCEDCRTAFLRTFEAGWSRNPLALSGLMRAAREVRRVVLRGDYDLVHVHTPVAGFVVRAALRRIRGKGRPKVVYTAHGFHFHPGGGGLNNALYLGLEKLAGHWTDFLIVINQVDHELALKHRLVPPDRLALIPGIGVDTRHYAPDSVSGNTATAAREEMGLPPGAHLFVMIAEFNPGKRHEDAIRALAMTGRRDVHLAFLGTGPLVGAIQRLAGRLGLTGTVHFLGFKPDVRPYLHSATAALLPSLREGLPRSLLEASSMGRPVIGTDIRGIRDLITSDTGFLTPPRDPAAIAAAMNALADSADLVKRMGEEGRTRVIRQFSLDRILSAHEAVYTALLRGRPS